MMFTIKRGVRACFLVLAVLGLPGKAAAVSCPGCFQAGFMTACSSCSATATTAFAGITNAIVASELAIGTALNEGPFLRPVPIGFPILYTQIEASRAAIGQNVTPMVSAVTQDIRDAIIKAPSVWQAQEASINSSSVVAVNDERGCRSLEYGALLDQNARSSLGYGWQYVTRGRVESIDGQPVGESVGAPEVASKDEDGVRAAMIDAQVKASQIQYREFQDLKARAAAAGATDASINQLLNPGMLYSASSKTFSDEPDESGLTDIERADYLIQYLMVDSPTFADDFGASATTPAEVAESVDGHVDNLRFGLAMSVLDEQMKLRMPRSGATQADAFLAKAMGEEAPAATSHDEFYYRLTHSRQKDRQWLAQVAVSDDYAIAEHVHMESEALAMKFERWLTKRQTTLLMAQVVANTLQSERDR